MIDFRHLMSKMIGSSLENEPEVVVIRDTISVRDSNGKVYDLEMDLKVEVDEAHLVKPPQNAMSTNNLTAASKIRSRSLGRQLRWPLNVGPWSKRSRSSRRSRRRRRDSDMDTSSDFSEDSQSNFSSSYATSSPSKKKSCSMKTVHLLDESNKSEEVSDCPDSGFKDFKDLALTRRSTSDLFRFTTV